MPASTLETITTRVRSCSQDDRRAHLNKALSDP